MAEVAQAVSGGFVVWLQESQHGGFREIGQAATRAEAEKIMSEKAGGACTRIRPAGADPAEPWPDPKPTPPAATEFVAWGWHYPSHWLEVGRGPTIEAAHAAAMAVPDHPARIRILPVGRHPSDDPPAT